MGVLPGVIRVDMPGDVRGDAPEVLPAVVRVVLQEDAPEFA